MTTQTGSYDFKAAKAAHDDAAKKASDYITEITDDGIMVHAEGEGPDDTPKPTGWHISNVLEFIREGVSRFWIGLKNQGDTTPTVRIGKAYNSQASDNESHMELDYHSMKLIDKEGSAYFYVSDLRNERGQMVETFTAPGGTNIFEVSMVPNGNASQAWATVDGADTQITDISTSSTNVHIADFPAAGAEVVIGYVPRWPGEAKAFTYGSRGSGAVGNMSFSAGYGNVADGKAAFAEGYGSTASGQASHAEGSGTALGIFSHAEGSDTVAGEYAHAEGRNAVASDGASHAEGFYTEASGYASHAQNRGTVAASEAQTALGKYNVDDENGTYAAIIGNGTADNARSNALAVEWNGNVEMGPRLTLDADSNNTGALRFQSDNRLGEFVKLYGGADVNGDAVVMGNGGLVVIGGGESGGGLYNELINSSVTPGDERLCLASDTSIYLYPNCQTIANRKELVVTNKGCIQSNAARSFGSHSWLSILNGETAMYVPKDRTNSTMAGYAVGALSIETPGGGGWTIGNYNSESLFFTYINGTERAAGRNTAYTVYMPAVSASKTICFTDHSHTYTDVGAAPATHYHNQYWDNTTSRTANTVLAAPNGSAGAPSFRKLVVADLPTGTTASTVALGNHTHAVTNKSYTGSNSAQIEADGTTSITVSGTSGGTYLTGFTYLHTNHNTVIGVIGNNETTVYVHNFTSTARAAKYCTVTEIRKYMF